MSIDDIVLVNAFIVLVTIWVPSIDGRPGHRYRAIVEAIAEAVASGVLRAGDRLPPQRELADALGLSLSTVTRAYVEAERRGLVAGEVGRGTYVRPAGAERREGGPALFVPRAKSEVIDLSINLPPVGDAGVHLARTLAELSQSSDLTALLNYEPVGGSGGVDSHAAAGARWIERLGVATSPEQVVLTAGAQHGLLVGLMATTRPGDALLVESLSYAPLAQLARHLKLTLLPLEMDDDGLRPDALDEACRTSAAKVLYTTPTLQTPTTATMPEDRRQHVAELADEHGLTIIEDDVFGFLPVDRPAPLARFAPERTVLVTSVSKNLAPGLRVGYLRTPPALDRAVRTATQITCWMPPPLMAEVATRWIEDGTAEALTAGQRTEIAARQGIAAEVLVGLGHRTSQHSLHLWLELPEAWRPDTFRAEAERQGVRLLTAEFFAVGQTPAPRAVRICLGYETSRERLAEGLRVVADLCAGADRASSPAL